MLGKTKFRQYQSWKKIQEAPNRQDTKKHAWQGIDQLLDLFTNIFIIVTGKVADVRERIIFFSFFGHFWKHLSYIQIENNLAFTVKNDDNKLCQYTQQENWKCNSRHDLRSLAPILKLFHEESNPRGANDANSWRYDFGQTK
jgi:hypothetical protein